MGKKTAIPKPSASDVAKRAADKEAARHAAVLLLAPADEYFGPLKLSIIGMRNTIRDLGLRYDVNHEISRQTFASAQLVERSVREWQHKYVRDDQLPRVIFVLQRLYTKVLTQESRNRARATAQWLLGDFGRSPQAKQLTKTLAYEHLAPLPPEPTATPESGTYRSIFGPGYPSEFAPSAPPTAEPRASFTASPAPKASATHPPAPKPSATAAPEPKATLMAPPEPKATLTAPPEPKPSVTASPEPKPSLTASPARQDTVRRNAHPAVNSPSHAPKPSGTPALPPPSVIPTVEPRL